MLSSWLIFASFGKCTCHAMGRTTVHGQAWFGLFDMVSSFLKSNVGTNRCFGKSLVSESKGSGFQLRGYLR